MAKYILVLSPYRDRILSAQIRSGRFAMESYSAVLGWDWVRAFVASAVQEKAPTEFRVGTAVKACLIQDSSSHWIISAPHAKPLDAEPDPASAFLRQMQILIGTCIRQDIDQFLESHFQRVTPQGMIPSSRRMADSLGGFLAREHGQAGTVVLQAQGRRLFCPQCGGSDLKLESVARAEDNARAMNGAVAFRTFKSFSEKEWTETVGAVRCNSPGCGWRTPEGVRVVVRMDGEDSRRHDTPPGLLVRRPGNDPLNG